MSFTGTHPAARPNQTAHPERVRILSLCARSLRGGQAALIPAREEKLAKEVAGAFAADPVKALPEVVEALIPAYGTGEGLEAALNDLFAALSPHGKVFIGSILGFRLGHLAMNTDVILRHFQLRGRPKDTVHVFLCGRVCNRQMLAMFQRHLPIVESVALAELFAGFKSFKTAGDAFHFRGPGDYALINSTRATLAFTATEEAHGRAQMEKMGLDPDRWFACVFARDQRYLELEFPGWDWSYHAYRNADIDTYIPAAELVLERGGQVARMGHHVEKPFALKREGVLDYALNGRDDFMDIYLAGKCRVFIGCGSGICDVPVVFDKPQLMVNSVPPLCSPIGKNCLYIPKRVKNRHTGELIPYHEFFHIFNEGNYPACYHGSMQHEMGLGYEDNTPEEILEATREMLDRLDGVHSPGPDVARDMEAFWSLYPPNHWSVNTRTPVAEFFMRAHRELFLPPGLR